jgi:hypothetical protein
MTPTETRTNSLVIARSCEQYENEGYVVFDRVLTNEQLALLHSGARYAMAKVDAEMDAQGVDRIGINARGRRYFSATTHRDHPELRSLIVRETGRVLFLRGDPSQRPEPGPTGCAAPT